MSEAPPPTPEMQVVALEVLLAKERVETARLRSLLAVVLDHNPDGIAVADAHGVTTANPAASQIFGTSSSDAGSMETWSADYGLKKADGKTPIPMEEMPMVKAMYGAPVDNELLFCRTPARPAGFWISCSARPLPEGGAISVFRDVTDRKQLEDDLAARNVQLAAREEEMSRLIEKLRAAVEQMSTPVLEIWEEVLAVPVVGVVDTDRSAQMVERLLTEVVAKRCQFVIIDLTGVDVIDTSSADRFIKMARAVELLGTRCIITGIQPAVSETLVELGIEFSGLTTHRNLKRALEVCTAQLTKERAGKREPRPAGPEGPGRPAPKR
ncbi:MAG TPA: STAS domain-containing protein [Polyangiaceae bacterium]|nr:STAS domain-containing protein [Polyangiaceae bacterium]